jgi:hypothetical protein
MEINIMTTKELILKYPKIFAPYEGNPDNVNWYGVPKGWLPIIDKLCGAIQNYLDFSKSYMPNPEYVEGLEYERDNIKTHKFIQQPRPQVTCVQMKEKFGGLRFYVNNSNETVNGMITMAEYLCDNTCEVCGSEENLGHTTGWITVCCKPCYDSGKGARGTWKPKIIK